MEAAPRGAFQLQLPPGARCRETAPFLLSSCECAVPGRVPGMLREPVKVRDGSARAWSRLFPAAAPGGRFLL